MPLRGTVEDERTAWRPCATLPADRPRPRIPMLYRFEGFELDTDLYRLVRGDEAVAIEPRVFEFLAYLIAHRDRVVGKDELIEHVWAGQFVSDSALSRCAYEARRALGQGTSKTKYIETVHGRGYLFSATVEIAESQPAVEAHRRTETPGAAPDANGVTAPARHRAALLVGIALSLAIAVATVVTVIDSDDRVPPPPQGAVEVEQPRSPRVAVLPTVVDDDSPELALVALSMADLLTSRLVSMQIIVRRPEYSSAVGAELQSLSQLADVAQVTHVVTSTARLAPDIRKTSIEFKLHDFVGQRPTTTPLGRFDVPFLTADADIGEFVHVRDAVVESLRWRIGTALSFGTEDPLAPRNPTAYRYYLLALEQLNTGFCTGGAMALIDEALKHDQESPQAWAVKATLAYNQVWACGASTEAYELALDCAARSLELAPDWYEPHLLKTIIYVETGRIEEAYEALTRLRGSGSLPPATHLTLEYVLRYAGYLEEAWRHCAEGLSIDPLMIATDPAGTVPNSLLYLGRLDQYLDHLPASNTAYHRFYIGFVEVLRGNEDRAKEILEPAFRADPGDLFGRFAHALLAILEGEPEAARAIVQQIARQRHDLGAHDGEMTYKQAQLLSLAGYREAALDQLEVAVDQGFFSYPYLVSDPVTAELRDDPRFLEIIAEAEARHLAFGQRFGLAHSPRAR